MADNLQPQSAPTPKRRFIASVRVRATAAAVAVLAAVLILGAAIVIIYSRDSLAIENIGATAQQRADVFAERLARGDSPATLVHEVEESTRDLGLIQLISPDGNVLGASDDLEHEGPISYDTWPQRVTIFDEDGNENFVAVTQTVPADATANAGTVLVYLYSSREAALPAQILLLVFAVGIPALLLAVGLTTWWLVGRAMKPVESMRNAVELITLANLDKRIAPPGGNDEIARLATTLNGMLDRLQTSQLAQRRFVSDASHELRSPLASIRQFAEVAQAYPDKISEGELATFTLAETLRMQRLVESMLLLAKSDEMLLQVLPSAVDLDDLLVTEASRVRSAQQLTVDASGISAAQTVGNGLLLGQAIRNLVDNAARHSATKIALSCGVSDNSHNGIRAWLTIDDDGPGIPPSERQKVFERFVRLDESRSRDAGGSGLGLAIVHDIILAHGGSVRIDDSPLGGARFTIFLPCAPEEN